MKTALYARVSTRDKDQNPEVQLRPMREYAAAKGWEVAEYVDKASAADYKRRSAWAQLRADTRRHRVGQVVIWRLDRAFRSSRECHNTLSDWDAEGIGFLVLSQPELNTQSSGGRLMLALLAGVAEFERDLIRERVRDGMENARHHGTKSGQAIGRPTALTDSKRHPDRSRLRRQWKELKPRILAGEISRRQAARELGLGLATIQRLLAADPKWTGPSVNSAEPPKATDS